MTVHLGQCEVCGQHAQTQFVTLRQQIGALVIRFEKKVEGRLCRACIDRYFWQFTPITALLGWWGVISLFVTPIYLATNLGTFISSRKLAAAPAAPGATSPPGAARAGAPGAGPRVDPYPGSPVPQGQPALLLRDDRTGGTVALDEGMTFGRSARKARVVIDDPRVSGLHARVVRVGDSLVLEDAGSSNGILVDGQPSGRSPLVPGMRVQLGDTHLTVVPRA